MSPAPSDSEGDRPSRHEESHHGRHLHFHRAGGGSDTILFLHGITESRRYFSRSVAALADRFEIVIPDLPGFGLSPKPSIRYSIDLFRDSVRTFVEHHGLDQRPIHIVGHSLGTLIALEYAVAHPEHVRRLALLNLPRHLSRAEAQQIFFEGSPSYRKLVRQRSLRASLVQLRRSGIAMSLRYARHFPWESLVDSRQFTFLSLTSTLENCLLNYRVDTALARMPQIPTLLIHGERDQVAPLANVRDLPRIYPWMSLVAIAGSGHHMLHTHRRQVLEAIRGFLS